MCSEACMKVNTLVTDWTVPVKATYLLSCFVCSGQTYCLQGGHYTHTHTRTHTHTHTHIHAHARTCTHTHTHRTPGTGLYDNLQQYKIPDPASIFDITFFAHNPRPFFALAKELYPGRYSPNPVHYFVRLLQERGLLLRNYTQNIDGLERSTLHIHTHAHTHMCTPTYAHTHSHTYAHTHTYTHTHTRFIVQDRCHGC